MGWGDGSLSNVPLLFKHEDPNLLSTVHIKSQALAAHTAFLMGRLLHRLVSVALSFYRDTSTTPCEQLRGV